MLPIRVSSYSFEVLITAEKQKENREWDDADALESFRRSKLRTVAARVHWFDTKYAKIAVKHIAPLTNDLI